MIKMSVKENPTINYTNVNSHTFPWLFIYFLLLHCYLFRQWSPEIILIKQSDKNLILTEGIDMYDFIKAITEAWLTWMTFFLPISYLIKFMIMVCEKRSFYLPSVLLSSYSISPMKLLKYYDYMFILIAILILL
jgi:hypothetical protein